MVVWKSGGFARNIGPLGGGGHVDVMGLVAADGGVLQQPQQTGEAVKVFCL